MIDPRIVTVLEGDVLQPDVGLSMDDLALVRERAHIIVHSASSIALLSSLSKLVMPIIDATGRLAHLALECKHLECFAFISSAYANSNLFPQTDGTSEVVVQESLYPLYYSANIDERHKSLQQEWSEVRKTGSSAAFESHDFPWAYAYAKHLTERLLAFTFASSDKRLLILRPSIIEPAQCFPYRGFCRPTSTPHIIAEAAGAISVAPAIRLASRFKNPNQDSTIDYVPVDVVVDRLLVHLALGTAGPVHAVAGDARMSFQDSWSRTFKHRKLPWSLRPKWLSKSWHSKDLHPIGRVYPIMGAGFKFVEDQSMIIWQQLSESERSKIHMFADKDKLYHDHEHMREDHLWICIAHLIKRRKLTRRLVQLLYHSLASTESGEMGESDCHCMTSKSL
jgi:fatty acyl-CoA reductase